jgi:hypothetical protein
MAKNRLSRELKPAEIPPDADESLPEAATFRRRSPDSKAVAGGAEHRAGAEQYEQAPPEEVPEREDPPRGRKPSGGQ